MNKSVTATLIFIFMLAATAPVSFAAQNSPQIYRFSMSGAYPESHPVTAQVILPWIEEIKSASKQRVLITYYPPNTLLPQSTHMEAVRRNSAAFAHQNIAVSRTPMPISKVLEVPSGLTSSQSASSSFWRLYRNLPELQKEYADIKMLGLHTTPPLQLFSATEINTYGELAGKKILCSGVNAALLLRTLDAIPLLAPESNWQQIFYEENADGALATFDTSLPLLPFTHVLCLDWAVEACWIGMNLNEWEALPRELKQVLENRSGEKLSLKIAQVLDNTCLEQQKELAVRGVAFQKPGDGQKKKWQSAVEPVAKYVWLEQMKNAKINDGEKMLERARRYYKTSESNFPASP